MFLVFNYKKLANRISLLLAIFFFASPVQASQPENELETQNIFHHQAEPTTSINEFHLSTHSNGPKIHIYYFNQQEPFSNPIAIEIFIECESHFFKLNRFAEPRGVKTYCTFEEPRIGRHPRLPQQTNHYLVLPVSEFDDRTGACPQAEAYELYPIRDIINFCESL